MSQPSPDHRSEPRGYLPRLAPEYYRGTAVVLWTHTLAGRATGWLDASFHRSFRELLMHAAAREHLLCPVYTLMPDHLHLVWMGVSTDSDQLRAVRFLRVEMQRLLSPLELQHQPHDHVLREEERRRGAFAAACDYVGRNPERAGLITKDQRWEFTSCVVPGYPRLDPRDPELWDKFWGIYAANVEHGRTGKRDA